MAVKIIATSKASRNGQHLQNVEALTLDVAASRLRVSTGLLNEMDAMGQIPARKLGEDWRFGRDSLLDWLNFRGRYQLATYVPPPPTPETERELEEFLAILKENRKARRRKSSTPTL